MEEPYLTLNEATEGVGTFPQHQRMSGGYDPDAPDSVTKLPLFESVTKAPNLDALELEPRARLTDLISSVPIIAAKVISVRLSDLLAQFLLAEHTIFPAVVHHRGKVLPGAYRVLHVPHLSCVVGEPTPAEASSAIAAQSPGLDLFVLHRPARLAATYVSGRLASALREGGYTGFRLGHGKLRVP